MYKVKEGFESFKKATQLVQTARDILEGKTTEEIDDLAPWEWCEGCIIEDIWCEYVEDNSDLTEGSFTAHFSDGSKAYWNNTRREWYEVD